MSTLGDTADVNHVIKFLPRTCNEYDAFVRHSYSWNKSTSLVKLPEFMFNENSFIALHAVLSGQTRHGYFGRRIFADLQWERNKGNRILGIRVLFVTCGHFNL